MKLLQPAALTLPKEIKQVGLFNRSLPDRGQGFLNVIEGILTGESIAADKEAARECLYGLASGLNNGPRFTAVIISDADLRGSGRRQFPEFLDWEVVDEFCSRYRVDALIALEIFDSNTALRESSADVERVVDKKKIKVKEYYVDALMNVNSGFTIYQPEGRKINDRNLFTDEMSWRGTGDSKDQALARLPSKRRALNQAAAFAGDQYARRISPAWITDSREFYRKANDDFKEAAKWVKRDQWEKAIIIWKKYTKDQDPKIAGRANYNMAVASEVEGNLSLAEEWARRAWSEYGLKKAKNYIPILQTRQYELDRLKQQMDD
ncbi:hypothetical protein MASR1M74_22620 [Lentimicrobium sp.]